MAGGAKIDHRSVGLLGILTICSYGSWYYSFGVLLDPIRRDTGWRESVLAASFSAGTVLVGLAALAGGRMLDRLGHRPVFMLGGAIGSAGLVLASSAQSITVFFVGAMVGLGAYGALGFYHVTMATAVRLNPSEPARAIAVLTIWGALASAIFLPGTDWLEGQVGWRTTVRILAAITATAFVAAAVFLPAGDKQQSAGRPKSIGAIVASTLREPAPRLLTLIVGCGGLAMSTLLVYQVPVMTAAGLGAATAASMAGLRGFCQLGGRLPLTPLVERVGRDGAMMLAMAAIATGGVLLVLSSTVPVAVAFAIVAGFGIGAFSPLQGMKAEELFDRDQLGATMGVYGAVLLLAGSIGPVLAGVIAEQTGERRWASAIVVVAALGALAASYSLSRLTATAPATSAV